MEFVICISATGYDDLEKLKIYRVLPDRKADKAGCLCVIDESGAKDMTKLTKEDVIFATGVFLKPVDCIINGIKQWRWVAVGFEDDSYFDGEAIDVYDYADNFQGLFKEEKIKRS